MLEALQARKQKLKNADRPRPRVSIAITIVYCATAALLLHAEARPIGKEFEATGRGCSFRPFTR
jgi:hypothetical protein